MSGKRETTEIAFSQGILWLRSYSVPAERWRSERKAPFSQGKMPLWWLRNSVCSNDIVQTAHLQQPQASLPAWIIITVVISSPARNEMKFQIRSSTRLWKTWNTFSCWTILPSLKEILPSLLSTSLYRWINFSLLISFWAPIGLDKSLNDVGDDRSNVYQAEGNKNERIRSN